MLIRIATLCFLLTLAASAATVAEDTSGVEVKKSYDFILDEWNEIAYTDGPVTLHRVRLDAREGGQFAPSKLMRPMNNEYLKMVKLAIEYTNQSSSHYKARVKVTWLDAEGRIIDGFSSREELSRKSAMKRVEISVPTFEYGLGQAATLNVEVDLIH